MLKSLFLAFGAATLVCPSFAQQQLQASPAYDNVMLENEHTLYKIPQRYQNALLMLDEPSKVQVSDKYPVVAFAPCFPVNAEIKKITRTGNGLLVPATSAPRFRGGGYKYGMFILHDYR